MKDERRPTLSRRALLRGAGAAGAAAAASAVGVSAHPGTAPTPPTGHLPAAAQAPPAAPTRVAFEHLTADEADLLETIADHLIPADDNGPGAVAAGAVSYIDRALGGALSGSRDAYRSGLAAFERYCRSSRGAAFGDLSHVDQVSALIDVETGAATGAGTGFAGSSGSFFGMVRSHVLQGTFGDPYYGGNQNFVGWDLIRYPGVRTAVSPGLQTQLESGALRPNHRSAYDSDLFEKATARAASKEMKHGD
jgi:gluconate 2-dehydrogenase gamma chain